MDSVCFRGKRKWFITMVIVSPQTSGVVGTLPNGGWSKLLTQEKAFLWGVQTPPPNRRYDWRMAWKTS